MDLTQETDMLRKIPMFAKLNASKLKLLAFTSHWLKFQPGEELCHEGDPGDSAYIITDGTAEVLVSSENGLVLVATRGKNEVIGEMSILCDTPRTATVRAKDTCSTLNISKDVFMQLLKGSPELSVQIIRTLANRLEESTVKLRDVTEKLVAAGLD